MFRSHASQAPSPIAWSLYIIRLRLAKPQPKPGATINQQWVIVVNDLCQAFEVVSDLSGVTFDGLNLSEQFSDCESDPLFRYPGIALDLTERKVGVDPAFEL